MYIDIVILLLIILSVAFGIKKGFIFEFFSLFGFIVAAFLAKKVSVFVYENLSGNIKNEAKFIITYIVIFLIIYLMLFLLILLIKKFFKIMLLVWLDRTLGGIFGFVRSVLFALLIVFVAIFISNYNEDIEKTVKKSIFCNIVIDTIPNLSIGLPKQITEKAGEYKRNRDTEKIINQYLKEVEKKVKGLEYTDDVKFESLKKLDIKEIDNIEKDINDILKKELEKKDQKKGK